MSQKFLVVGTSHTAGCCERSDSKFINKQDTWHYKLASLLQLDYDVIGIPGTENWQLVQQLVNTDLKQYKFVLAEVRLGSFLMPIPYDEIGPDEDMYDVNKSNIQDFIGQAIRSQSQVNDKITQTLLDAYTIYHSSVTSYYRSCCDINTMLHLCNLCNIPFYWTAFSETLANQESTVNQHFKKVTKQKFADCFSRQIPSKTIKQTLNISWDDSSCTCGHFDESFQAEIATLLHKYIKA